RLIASLFIALALSSGGLVYKIDVQQGNYVPQDAVARLKTGMTKTEVRQLLGTPLLIDAFHANRWDYLFTNQKGRTTEKPTRLTIVFQNERGVSFSGEGREPPPPPVGSPTPAPPSQATTK